jgi:hypothetical protein
MSSAYRRGPVTCRGSFTGEFGLGDELPIEEAPYVIERDRINEGRLPGFNRKLLPMKVDEGNGKRTAGGYYLLDTLAQAKYMYEWYQDPDDGFVLDGIPILQRTYFKKPIAHYWQVIGAHDFKPLMSAQRVVRFERWRCRADDAGERLAGWWPELRDEAADGDLAALWLLFNPDQDDSIGLVSAADRGVGTPADQPDFPSVRTLEQSPSLGARFEQDGFAERSFDRSSWIFSIWFPYDGPQSLPTLWPNSPPFPGL